MQQYHLTERGKSSVAIILTILLIVMPSVIFVIWTLVRADTPDSAANGSYNVLENGSSAASSGQPSDASSDGAEASSGNGSGDNGSGENSDIDSNTSDPSPDISPAFDLEAGTMTFVFTPGEQTYLDEDTVSSIGRLLTSPKNTINSIVYVEIPQLQDDYMVILTSAISGAFQEHSVPLSDILFFVYSPDPDAESFNINISFYND